MSAYTELFAELVGLEIELWGRLDVLLTEETGVSVAQLQALRALASREGAARVQDVSDELQITVGAASKLVDRLDRDGLAERAAHPTDRRSMVIALTEEGVSAYRRAEDASSRILQELLSGGLSKARAGELTGVLASVRATLSADADAGARA